MLPHISRVKNKLTLMSSFCLSQAP